jgi:hypothetical protein
MEQPFQPFNKGIIAHWPAGSPMLSEKSYFGFLSMDG